MFLIILKKQHHKYLLYSNLFCRASIHCPGAQTPRKKAVCVLPGTPGESGSERVLVQDRRLNGMSIGGQGVRSTAWRPAGKSIRFCSRIRQPAGDGARLPREGGSGWVTMPSRVFTCVRLSPDERRCRRSSGTGGNQVSPGTVPE